MLVKIEVKQVKKPSKKKKEGEEEKATTLVPLQ